MNLVRRPITISMLLFSCGCFDIQQKDINNQRNILNAIRSHEDLPNILLQLPSLNRFSMQMFIPEKTIKRVINRNLKTI